MKFCPECGYELKGANKCRCGYEIGKKRETSNTSTIYPKNRYNSIKESKEVNKKTVSMSGYIKLEELKKKKLDLGNLLEISYTSSGGMMGCYYNTMLSVVNKEIKTTTRVWHHDDTVIRKYKIEDDILDKVLSLIDENNLKAWGEIPVDRSKMGYDMENSSMSLKYDNESIDISFLIYMDEEEHKIFFEIRDLIYSSVSNESLISEEINECPEKATYMQFMGMDIPNKQENKN